MGRYDRSDWGVAGVCFFQAEDGIRDLVRSRGLGDVYKRQVSELPIPDEIKRSGDKEIKKYIDSKRLAYYDDAQVWWCPSCRIVCANEEVLYDGSHEKCGNKVEKKNLKQWMLRIPLYAERLLSGFDKLEWPEGIKAVSYTHLTLPTIYSV